MTAPTDHKITSIEQLRAIYGHPKETTKLKLMSALDRPSREFIGRSPFIVLATSDADGNLDASPKGDAPGFVAIEDDRTILIPDRRGNKLLFGLGNIVANPQVGIIFIVPGTGETFRINGVAELTDDPAILARLEARGMPALIAIRVRIRECFFHCAKAFIRSQLWEAGAQGEKFQVSFGRMYAEKLGGGDAVADEIDRMIAKDYKENL